jgi:1,4-dihydroxy-2-naphthoate octaprenyltransferase
MACRPFAYPWIIVNAFFGNVLAGFNFIYWVKSSIITISVLTAGHFYNSWLDYVRGFDKADFGSKPKPYTAGSQVLPRGWLSLRTVEYSTYAWTLLSLLLMMSVPFRLDVWLLYILGLTCAYTYTAILKPRGLGEIGLFLGHGFATTTFSYALVKPLDATGISAGILLGFWAGVVYTVDQWMDVETDFARRVKNLAYMMFKANMRISQLWYFLLTGSYTLQFAFILLGWLPAKTLLSILILPNGTCSWNTIGLQFREGGIIGARLHVALCTTIRQLEF